MRRAFHVVVLFAALMAFWVVLSGMLDPFHLGLGAFSAAVVVWLSAAQLYSRTDRGGRTWLTLLPWGRVAAYLPWLGWEIAKANWQVAKLVLGPRSRLAPRVVTFRSELSSELSKVVLANSITLTPGTVTLDVLPDGTYVVHAVDAAAAEGLLEGTMQRKVARTFAEDRA